MRCHNNIYIFAYEKWISITYILIIFVLEELLKLIEIDISIAVLVNCFEYLFGLFFIDSHSVYLYLAIKLVKWNEVIFVCIHYIKGHSQLLFTRPDFNSSYYFLLKFIKIDEAIFVSIEFLEHFFNAVFLTLFEVVDFDWSFESLSYIRITCFDMIPLPSMSNLLKALLMLDWKLLSSFEVVFWIIFGKWNILWTSISHTFVIEKRKIHKI